MNIFNPYDHFGFLTNRVGRLIAHMMQNNTENKEMGFPTSCIGIMAELWQKDGITQTELCQSLIKTKSSINKMLESLSEDGMIIKKMDPSDKRAKRVYLTEKGKEFQQFIQSKSKISERKYLEGVPDDEIKIAKKVLTTLYKNLSKAREENNNRG